MALRIVFPLLVLLPFAVPVFCTFFLNSDGAVQSPSTFFFHWPGALGFVQYQSMGDGSYPGWNLCLLHLNNCGCFNGGIGQDTPASKNCVDAGIILGHGVSSLFCGAAASGCCLGWSVLQLGAEGFSSTWAFLWGRGFPQIPLALDYTQSLEWMRLLILPLVFGLLLSK